MASRPYSIRIVSAYVRSDAEESGALWTVPGLHVFIARSVTWWVYTPGQVLWGRLSGGNIWPVSSSQGIAALSSRTDEMRQVFNAGELLGPSWNSPADVTLTVSGYLLDAPA